MRTWQKRNCGQVPGDPVVYQTKSYAKSSITTRTFRLRNPGPSARSVGCGVGRLLGTPDSGRRFTSFPSLGCFRTPHNTDICVLPSMGHSSLSLHPLKRCVQFDDLEMHWWTSVLSSLITISYRWVTSITHWKSLVDGIRRDGKL